jgi:hypothetical protein
MEVPQIIHDPIIHLLYYKQFGNGFIITPQLVIMLEGDYAIGS